MRKWVLAGAAVVAFSTMGASSCSTTANNSSGSAPTTDASVPTDNSTPAPAAAPTPPPAPVTIFTLSGNGTKNTADFTVPDEWTLAYTFDCSSFGQAGNFQVYTYGADGTIDFSGPTVNELQMKGNSSTAGHGDSGKKYLAINSECAWTVTVTG